MYTCINHCVYVRESGVCTLKIHCLLQHLRIQFSFLNLISHVFLHVFSTLLFIKCKSNNCLAITKQGLPVHCSTISIIMRMGEYRQSEYQTEIFATVPFPKYWLWHLPTNFFCNFHLNDTCSKTNTRRIILGRKRWIGRYAKLSFYADLTHFILSSYRFWLIRWMNFSQKLFDVPLGPLILRMRRENISTIFLWKHQKTHKSSVITFCAINCVCQIVKIKNQQINSFIMTLW